MKDTIFERQNDDEVLDLLYSQRVSYDHAEIFNRIGWTMTLLLLFLAVGKLFVPFLEHSSGIVEIIVAVGIFAVDYKTKMLITWGAETKGLIDNILFGFPIQNKEKLIEYAIKIKNKNKEDYKLQTTHKGDDIIRGVRDWYTEYSSDDHYKVILNCQKENVWWNVKLVSYYKKIVISFIGISVLLVASFISYLAIKIDFAWSLIILGSTIFIRSIEQMIAITIYTKAMEHASAKIELIEADSNNLNLESLLSLQKDIEENRKSGFLVPSWVHYMYSKHLHKEKKEINERMVG
ncbi:hypothetical protein GN277_28780 (plasmid) [Lachnospiraceae bacterium WCA-9-b2]|jgi:hypothetical protein|uniref:Uncharacterized protein n=1 Tax=Sporofaciens musculi TaxID=2681861 RepID=A0A7X3SM96_9FIRM|nr:S-4TM family putative pore-forming effector [Sporofaciens musculi]MXP79151.1 hypothetical protein [Sporofaciens musculi]NBJ02390.1 hypothetical protein [Lachnospiraceae bacterium]